MMATQLGSQHVSVIVICVFAACVVCALDEFDATATRLHWIYLDENCALIRLPLLEKNLKPPRHFMKDEWKNESHKRVVEISLPRVVSISTVVQMVVIITGAGWWRRSPARVTCLTVWGTVRKVPKCFLKFLTCSYILDLGLLLTFTDLLYPVMMGWWFYIILC